MKINREQIKYDITTLKEIEYGELFWLKEDIGDYEQIYIKNYTNFALNELLSINIKDKCLITNIFNGVSVIANNNDPVIIIKYDLTIKNL